MRTVDRFDEKEMQAQLVVTLNDLQAANERSRSALIRADLGELAELARYIVDRGVALATLTSAAMAA